MSITIAEHVVACFGTFNSIISLSDAGPENQPNNSEWKIRDELPRFKVWSGNIGAHQRGKRSLDYRLRDASHLASQVKSLLEDLKDSLDNAYSIMDGTKIPWDQELPENDDGNDEPMRDSESDDIGFATELDQIAADVSEVIKCLMNLSVSIRNPAPHDRFRASSKTDTSFYEPTDIGYVREKLDKADPRLIALLGKANTRRRQYFKYREAHHHKLSHNPDLDPDRDSEQQSTIASSIPAVLKTRPVRLDEAMDVDELSDSGFTQTSYASSANTSDRPRFPALPSGAAEGPFQCPFCFMMINVTTSHAWRKHIFADLRPYICLAVDCPIAGTEFGRRHQWMQHMMQNHWREWRCVFCVHEPFTSSSRLRDHLQRLHPGTVPKEAVETAINICEHPTPLDTKTKCPLCYYSLGSVKTYRHHVGRHLEDIALFVLPQIPGEDELSDDENSTSSGSELNPDYIDPDSEEQMETESPLENEESRMQINSDDGQEHDQSRYHDREEEKKERAGSFGDHNAPIMAPPSINIDFAPNSRTNFFEPAKPAVDWDSLAPPNRGIWDSLTPPNRVKTRSRKHRKMSGSIYDLQKRGAEELSNIPEQVICNRPRSRPRAVVDPYNSGGSPIYGPGTLNNLSPHLAAPRSSAAQDNRTQKHSGVFQCTLCPKRFTRAYNLRAHLRTHTDERPFVCTICGKAFARQHDRQRHEELHSGEEKKFVCKGDLKGGGQWGCGRRFARADALGGHFRSEAGRICIKPLLDEETRERQHAFQEQQLQPSMDIAAPQPMPKTPDGGFELPESLLTQYPVLTQANWQAAEDNDDGDDTGNLSGPGTGSGEGSMQY